MPAFLRQDAQAFAKQRLHRRLRLFLMVGTALTVIFGAVQAAADDVRWPGAVLAILGLSAAGIANTYRRSKPLARYLTARAKAEELRSTYFRYISGVSGLNDRGLEAMVASIEHPRSDAS